MPEDPRARARESIRRHYSHGTLLGEILGALRAAGKDVEHLSLDDLAPVDEFHVRGREATRELAGLLTPRSGTRILDAGCGLGGAARRLAAEHDCRVTGVDLNPEYCKVAGFLGTRLDLGARLEFITADVARLPFTDASFDIVWSQHVAMNIADKAGLYREWHRVSRPGGRLAIYDVVAGSGGEPLYPAPWASDADGSHLVGAESLSESITAAGFVIETRRDCSDAGRQWFRRFTDRLGGKPMPLGIHLLFGQAFREMAENQRRNLEEHRIGLIQLVARAASLSG